MNSLLIQGGGSICASLDAHGAINLVLSGWICNWFQGWHQNSSNREASSLDNMVNNYKSYSDFESAMKRRMLNIKVSPNPADKELNLNTMYIGDEEINYYIMDINGRVMSKVTYLNSENGFKNLDTSNLKSGLYILKIESKYRSTNQKIQIKR